MMQADGMRNAALIVFRGHHPHFTRNRRRRFFQQLDTLRINAIVVGEQYPLYREIRQTIPPDR
jgi:hypothetical protein